MTHSYILLTELAFNGYLNPPPTVLSTIIPPVAEVIVSTAVVIVALNDPTFKGGLNVEHEDIVLIVFGLLGMINGSAILQLCCCNNRKKPINPKQKNEKQGKYRQRFNKFIQSEWLIVGAEMLEIPLQSIQCYLIHEHTMSQMYALLFTTILISNCWMLAYPNASIKHCILIDIAK